MRFQTLFEGRWIFAILLVLAVAQRVDFVVASRFCLSR